jgi:hypothetical protein
LDQLQIESALGSRALRSAKLLEFGNVVRVVEVKKIARLEPRQKEGLALLSSARLSVAGVNLSVPPRALVYGLLGGEGRCDCSTPFLGRGSLRLADSSSVLSG